MAPLTCLAARKYLGAIAVPRTPIHWPSYCQPLFVSEPDGAFVLNEGSPVDTRTIAWPSGATKQNAKKHAATTARCPCLPFMTKCAFYYTRSAVNTSPCGTCHPCSFWYTRVAMKVRTLGVIPARFGAQRFPGKPLALIAGKTLVQRVYEQAARARRLNKVIVATETTRILEAVEAFGGDAMLTSPECATGTDRVAEVARAYDCDLVLNI